MSITLTPNKNFTCEIAHKKVQLFTLKNAQGMVAQITNYGAKLVALWTADRQGHFEDIVLGFEHIHQYLNAEEVYFGAIVGRYANRIAEGQFLLGTQQQQLSRNNGTNHLHGGYKGFSAVVWNVKQSTENCLVLQYFSPHLAEGYQGNLTVEVCYILTNDNALNIDYKAISDKDTIVNLTHHSFFNLKGAGVCNILNHQLQVNATTYTPVNADLIPTGQLNSVNNTPFDFRQFKAIGQAIDSTHPQIKLGKGYDHNFVLTASKLAHEPRCAAIVKEPVFGRTMEVWTTQPGMQLYTANFKKTLIGKYNRTYVNRAAFCLETQHFPDSPNHAHFPSAILPAMQQYHETCSYHFS